MLERGTIATLSVLAIFAAGCSISASSASIGASFVGSSQGIAASSKSFSDSMSSSSPDGESKSEQAYREDVGDYTATWARTRSDLGDGVEFQKGLAVIAERHGVTNWEADRATYLGIGQGLRSAGVEPAGLSTFKDRLNGPAGSGGQLIEQGYGTSAS